AKRRYSNGAGRPAPGLVDGPGQFTRVDGIYAGGGTAHHYLPTSCHVGVPMGWRNDPSLASALGHTGAAVSCLYSGLQAFEAVYPVGVLSVGYYGRGG